MNRQTYLGNLCLSLISLEFEQTFRIRTMQLYIVAFNIELAFNNRLQVCEKEIVKRKRKKEDKISPSEITKHIKDVIEKFRPIKYP